METVAGASATDNTPATKTPKRRGNPARARRSRLRLEQFQMKKEDEKKRKHQETGVNIAAGDSSSICNTLVLQLNEEKRNVETGPLSPILQVDGIDTALMNEVSFSFKSEYGEEDIRNTLGEIFPPFVAQLDSRVRLGRLAADHQCIVSLRPFGRSDKLTWPKMSMDEEEVFRELQRIT